MDLRNRILGAGHRVFTGIGAVAGFLVFLGQYLALVPAAYQGSQWYAVAAALVALGAAIKMPGASDPAVLSPKPPAVPPAAVALLVGASLLFAAPAFADDPPPPVAPLAVSITPDLSLHLAVAVPAFAYSITRGEFLGQLTFGLAYVLDYKKLVAVGIGGGYLQTNDQPGMMFTGMLAGPVLPFSLSDGISIRPAVLYEYEWLGAVHDQKIAATMALQF